MSSRTELQRKTKAELAEVDWASELENDQDRNEW